jgi:hypothetical protein
MHHSYSPGRTTFELTAYLDDSGSDDLNPITTIGGPVMSKDALLDFSNAWSKLLPPYRVQQPLHMKDFIRPHGQHSGMFREMKLSLFRAVADIINGHKLYSTSVAVSGADFNSLLSEEVRKSLIGPYALGFFTTILTHHNMSSTSLLFAAERITCVVDTGFPFSEQLVKAHASIIDLHKAKGQACFVGSLRFDKDDQVPALQAADVIAWAARRREVSGLADEFEPLKGVVGGDRHFHISLPKSGIDAFAKPINNWLSIGTLPVLRDIQR